MENRRQGDLKLYLKNEAVEILIQWKDIRYAICKDTDLSEYEEASEILSLGMAKFERWLEKKTSKRDEMESLPF